MTDCVLGEDPQLRLAEHAELLECCADSGVGLVDLESNPRPLIRAIVEVMRPEPGTRIGDPACGTGGFLLGAHESIAKNHLLDPDEKQALRYEALKGWEIVDNTARLCVMNLPPTRPHGECEVRLTDLPALNAAADVVRDAHVTKAMLDRLTYLNVTASPLTRVIVGHLDSILTTAIYSVLFLLSTLYGERVQDDNWTG
jgi:hypothetical protein